MEISSGEFVHAGLGLSSDRGESGEFGEFVSPESEARTSFQRRALACSPAEILGHHFRPPRWTSPFACGHLRNPYLLADTWRGNRLTGGSDGAMCPNIWSLLCLSATSTCNLSHQQPGVKAGSPLITFWPSLSAINHEAAFLR
jgi:hypothetical protein